MIFALSEQVCEFTSEIFHHLINCPTVAGIEPTPDQDEKMKDKERLKR